MNHRYLRELKALNIRDVLNKATCRRSMGLFKANANFKGRLQEEELHSLVSFAYNNGYYKDLLQNAVKKDWNNEHPLSKRYMEKENNESK